MVLGGTLSSHASAWPVSIKTNTFRLSASFNCQYTAYRLKRANHESTSSFKSPENLGGQNADVVSFLPALVVVAVVVVAVAAAPEFGCEFGCDAITTGAGAAPAVDGCPDAGVFKLTYSSL